jgi:hypothetical protein
MRFVLPPDIPRLGGGPLGLSDLMGNLTLNSNFNSLPSKSDVCMHCRADSVDPANMYALRAAAHLPASGNDKSFNPTQLVAATLYIQTMKPCMHCRADSVDPADMRAIRAAARFPCLGGGQQNVHSHSLMRYLRIEPNLCVHPRADSVDPADMHAIRAAARFPGSGRRTAIAAWRADDRLGTFLVTPANSAPGKDELWRLRMPEDESHAGPAQPDKVSLSLHGLVPVKPFSSEKGG